MEPTKRIVMGQKLAQLPLKNVIEYFPGEIFIEVIYYDGRTLPWYYISNYGRLYSCRYERLMSSYLDEGGYYRNTIVIDESGKTCFTGIHKLEIMSFYPIIESNLYVPNHKDGNKTNNYLGNLEWITISGNTRHALDTGLSKCKAEDSSTSYLSNDQIHMICKMMEQGKSNSEILDKLGYTEYGPTRNKVAAILRHIHAGATYLSISSQYNIPGTKGRRYYSPDFTELVCQFLNDGNEYSIEQLCDYLNIGLDDRKLFKYYVESVVKGRCDTHITQKYHNLKCPKNVPKDHPYYNYYN